MPRKVKKSRSFLGPIAGSFIKRISGADARLRRKVSRLGLWGIVLLFAWSLLSGTYGIPRIVRLELEKRALTESNLQKRASLVDSARIKKKLLHDPKYIEIIARTRCFMIYPGETIYRYQGRK